MRNTAIKRVYRLNFSPVVNAGNRRGEAAIENVAIRYTAVKCRRSRSAVGNWERAALNLSRNYLRSRAITYISPEET